MVCSSSWYVMSNSSKASVHALSYNSENFSAIFVGRSVSLKSVIAAFPCVNFAPASLLSLWVNEDRFPIRILKSLD